MIRFRSFVAGALVAGVLAGGAVFAQGPRGGGRGAGMMGGPGLPLRELGLSESQQQQIRDVRERYRESSRAAGEKLQSALAAQRKAIEAVPVNEGLIRSTSQALAEAQTEVALQQAQMHSDVWTLLTPAQQAQARKLQSEREARFQQRREQRERRQQNQG